MRRKRPSKVVLALTFILVTAGTFALMVEIQKLVIGFGWVPPHPG
jgi:hypothetical protein